MLACRLKLDDDGRVEIVFPSAGGTYNRGGVSTIVLDLRDRLGAVTRDLLMFPAIRISLAYAGALSGNPPISRGLCP